MVYMYHIYVEKFQYRENTSTPINCETSISIQLKWVRSSIKVKCKRFATWTLSVILQVLVVVLMKNVSKINTKLKAMQ